MKFKIRIQNAAYLNLSCIFFSKKKSFASILYVISKPEAVMQIKKNDYSIHIFLHQAQISYADSLEDVYFILILKCFINLNAGIYYFFPSF